MSIHRRTKKKACKINGVWFVESRTPEGQMVWAESVEQRDEAYSPLSLV